MLVTYRRYPTGELYTGDIELSDITSDSPGSRNDVEKCTRNDARTRRKNIVNGGNKLRSNGSRFNVPPVRLNNAICYENVSDNSDFIEQVRSARIYSHNSVQKIARYIARGNRRQCSFLITMFTVVQAGFSMTVIE